MGQSEWGLRASRGQSNREKGKGGGGDLKKRKRTKQNKPTEFKKIIYKILRNFNFFIKLNEYPLHSINLPLKGK